MTFTDSNQLYYFTSTNTCGSITDSVQVMVFGYAGQALETPPYAQVTPPLFMQTMEKVIFGTLPTAYPIRIVAVPMLTQLIQPIIKSLFKQL